MKRLFALLLAGAAALSVAACGGGEDFDAAGYVQGVLDAQYHGDYARHAEDVGETEEAIEQEITDKNLEMAKSAIAESGIEATDEEIQEYVDLIMDGYQKIGYEVQDAVKDDNDNYTVDVVVTPLGILDSLEDIFTEKLADAVSDGAGESEYMSVFNESVRESISQAEPMDSQTVTLNVTYTEDEDGNRVYGINESDLDMLDSVATNQL